MREVIQELIEVERQARALVQSAREEADRLVAEARHQAHDAWLQASHEARAEAAKAIADAVEAARLEKAKRLQAATVDIQSQVRLDEALQASLVDAVVRCVCGPT